MRTHMPWSALALVLAVSGACGGSPAARSPASRGAAPASDPPANGSGAASSTALLWDYDVTVDAALDLDVRATLHGPISGRLGADDDATTFIDHVEVQEGATWRSSSLSDARWAAACAMTCTLRYHVRLREAAKVIADVDTAIAAGGAIFAPPSTWLVRPSEVPPGRYRFRVSTPPGIRFATGVRAAASGADTYEAPTSTLEEAAFAAFGPLRVGHVADPDIAYAAAPELPLSDDVLTHWLRAEVDAVATYFARPPGGHAMLFVAPGTSASTSGKTLGGGGAAILVRLAPKVTARDVEDDWVVAHELIHVAFPDLGRGSSWASEGLATYVEPIARERARLVSREKVWADMLEGMPQGLPGPRDGGLEGSREWGRVYWGGALFFFLADVRVRELTGNARGLENGLRAVVATGANVETTWPISRVIDVADAATGTHVLRDLYSELGNKRGTVDLDGLFRRLGVRLEGAVVRFDDKAPLAAVRDAILPVRRPGG